MTFLMRDEKVDNLKGILMILVVFGHLLELIMTQGWTKYVYEIIYSFHMPFFIFLSGYFFKYNFSKIVKNLVYPYVVFQTLYLIFAKFVLGIDVSLQYNKPYWLLWYLLGMVVWSLLMPLLPRRNATRRILSILFTFILCIAIGFSNYVGRDYSLSRIIVFFPFFLLGRNYADLKSKIRQMNDDEKFDRILKWIGYFCSAIVIVYAILLLTCYKSLKMVWFYEAQGYDAVGTTVGFRVLHMIIALCFIFAGIQWIPKRNIGILSRIGRNTMQIYLLHGFIVRLLDKWKVFDIIPLKGVFTIILTMVIVCVLSSDFIRKVFRIFICFK